LGRRRKCPKALQRRFVPIQFQRCFQISPPLLEGRLFQSKGLGSFLLMQMNPLRQLLYRQALHDFVAFTRLTFSSDFCIFEVPGRRRHEHSGCTATARFCSLLVDVLPVKLTHLSRPRIQTAVPVICSCPPASSCSSPTRAMCLEPAARSNTEMWVLRHFQCSLFLLLVLCRHPCLTSCLRSHFLSVHHLEQHRHPVPHQTRYPELASVLPHN
jgi:hypothetical protein